MILVSGQRGIDKDKASGTHQQLPGYLDSKWWDAAFWGMFISLIAVIWTL